MDTLAFTINGVDFTDMVVSGSNNLRLHADQVNTLNVFPVPDGDTGTNMNMSLSSGIEELKKRPSSHIGKAADVLAKGLLMGARGNSGVILSQLFRGFAKSIADLEEINAQQFAEALKHGVDTAYKAVVKPVEGTILTVSREAAQHAILTARSTKDLQSLMQEVLNQAKHALGKTPDLLPILKQAGVVDAGGQGLVHIYEGFLSALNSVQGTSSDLLDNDADNIETHAASMLPLTSLAEEAHKVGRHPSAQAIMSTEDIEFGYCTEFLLMLQPEKPAKIKFNQSEFRKQLEKWGNSLMLVADDEWVRIHIHAEYPGEVMNLAAHYGELSRIKIENMREQHRDLLMTESSNDQEYLQKDLMTFAATEEIDTEVGGNHKKYGVVTVASGKGISEIFSSLGAGYVLSGGQTMNPSTEDIIHAIHELNAETVYILPNNSNIILAAQQAKGLVEGCNVIVIPTKSIPQGIAAMLRFQEDAEKESNTASMLQAVGEVRSGQVTYAVRDSNMEGLRIVQGDYLGILDDKIVASHSDIATVCEELLQKMIVNGDEILAIYTGKDAVEKQTADLIAYAVNKFPKVELEVHYGGQPVYTYLISAE